MTVLTVRLDSSVERALEYLLSQREGETRSDIVREAILAAEKAAKRAHMREESAALAADPEERAAAKLLAAEMAEYSAW
jgi:metal-responsive CopG/Arc/MetJ family transcriptional regulator